MMAGLSAADRERVRKVINEAKSEFAKPGVLRVEPGFAVTDGKLIREPAIVVYVEQRLALAQLTADERLPDSVGGIAVDVVPAPLRVQRELRAADAPPLAPIPGAGAAAAAKVPTYVPMAGDPIDVEVELDSPLLCHVGPDSGWIVLRDFLAATNASLVAAMYDFNADYIATTLIETAQQNGFDIELAFDDSRADAEKKIQARLKKKLSAKYDVEVIFCRAGGAFPSAYHEKVAVQDGARFWISSGNWSLRSQPLLDPLNVPAEAKGMYSKGNREWHLVVEDAGLSDVFTKYIEHDRARAKADAAAGGPIASVPSADVFVPLTDLVTAPTLAVVQPVAPQKLPTGNKKFKIRPLLSPDNYAARIDELVRSAKKSLYLQYAYITWSGRAQDKLFNEFLEYLGELSNDAAFDLRVIIGSSSAFDDAKLLAQEAGWNADVVRSQGSIHNKGIIADGKKVLVSSQNWSSDGFLRNRDAGLLVTDPEVAGYFQDVFLDDWTNRAHGAFGAPSNAILAAPGVPTPAGMVRMSVHDYVGD